MIPTLIFSRDRACQLDALLRSLAKHALGSLSPVRVLWKVSTGFYDQGYKIVSEEYGKVGFQAEESFRRDVMRQLTLWQDGLVCFMCDDDLAYARVGTSPLRALTDRRILAFNLRLGRNTTFCYSMDDQQEPPFLLEEDGWIDWEWHGASLDWGYAGSLDGTVYRVADVLAAIGTEDFSNPNELEDVLHLGLERFSELRPIMAAYPISRLVGCPINLVNSTHRTNRHGTRYPRTVEDLNRRYLDGARIDLDALKIEPQAAHCEVELVMR